MPLETDLPFIQTWLESLADPRFHCETHLRGTPGRMRIPANWSAKHCFPEHLFYFPLEGGLAGFLEGGEEFRSTPGELIWVPADTAFHFWLPPEDKLYLCRFRLSANRPIAQGAPAPIRFPGAGNCRPWMERLAIEAEAATPIVAPYQPERVRGLLLCLFTELARREPFHRAAAPAGLTATQQTAVREYLTERAAQVAKSGWPTPADLARHLRLSPDYFTRLFTRGFGQPPRRWLLEQRIRLAALRLAESPLNVSEVAAEFGYDNVFLFSRQFRQVLGRSPSEHRRSPEADRMPAPARVR